MCLWKTKKQDKQTKQNKIIQSIHLPHQYSVGFIFELFSHI